MKTCHHLTFITPLFSRGSYDDLPEIRPPSIRGQLRWWFRALGGSYAQESAIFGGVHSKPPLASKVVVRVANILPTPGKCDTLPHKKGGPAAPRIAFKPGTSFDLLISERLGGLSDSEQKFFRRALDAWLLAGSLGLRVTRGGGAFQRDDSPADPTRFRLALDQVFSGTKLSFDLLEECFKDAERAREVITDTIFHGEFSKEYHPLGGINLGNLRRKTSPLRLTVRKFSDGFRILAIWDGRENVTGNTRAQLHAAIQKLAHGTPKSGPKKIGRLLATSSLAK